jgi:hypothetical protein
MILMTSWFDESQQTWRANAPDYAHLSFLLATARVQCTTRKAALDTLSKVLTSYFATLDQQ